VLRTLYNFQGQPDGADPQSSLFKYSVCTDKCSQWLFGTTSAGGTNNAGTIYSLYTPNVTYGTFSEEVLLSFTSSETGSDPTSSVFRSKYGTLFATASQGGTHDKGTVVKFKDQTVVLSFDGHDGATPTSGLTPEVRNGAYQNTYYATTFAGGGHERGAILAIRPSTNKFSPKVLYSFNGASDGAHPNSQLSTFGSAHPYFGTTAGSKSAAATVYSFVPNQGLTTVYTFKNSKEGATPTGVYATPLTYGKPLLIFGTTFTGGSSGYGILYELKPTGSKYTKVTLHTFAGGKADGAYPQGPPTSPGYNPAALYGVTAKGGSHNCGTVFRFDLSSEMYAVLYSFKCGKDGAYPEAPLTATTGSLIGTTSAGGTANNGTVFLFKAPGTL